MLEFVCRENGYLWRVPELCSDQWNSAEGHSRKCIIVGEWTSSIQHLPDTELHTKGYCYKQEVAIVLIVLSHDRGNPLVLTSVLFIANLLYKRRVKLTRQLSSVVQIS